MDNILSLTSPAEKELLAELAKEVPTGGLIVEIGCLYGGTTYILASANPHATVLSIDDFSWSPPGHPKSSLILTEDNLKQAGVKNTIILEGDSRKIAPNWDKPIDLLWIDGGHSLQYVYSDLYNFGKYAKVIALHDYKNPAWDTIEKAVDVFLRRDKSFKLMESVDMIAVLRRTK